MFADVWAALLREPYFLSQDQLEDLTNRQIAYLYFRERIAEVPESVIDEPTCEADIIAWCEQARAGMGGFLCRADEDFAAWVEESLVKFRAEQAEKERGERESAEPI